MKVAVYFKLYILLGRRILNYLLKYHYLHILHQLHIKYLGRYYIRKCQHHLLHFLSFDFKPTLILNVAMICPDRHTSYLHSTHYSYYPSGLNLPVHCGLVISSLSLQCYPQYYRINDIVLAYSSLLLNRKRHFA